MKNNYLAQFFGKSQNYTDIPNQLFTEYNVKKGLRNEDGTGVCIGLTKISEDVYKRQASCGLFLSMLYYGKRRCVKDRW